MAEILLTEAIFGMGNANHDHVHRHNQLNVSTMNIDALKMEQFQGGVTPVTMNKIANESGNLSQMPQGWVNIEDGFNIRRGIGLLRFIVESNSLESSELSVMGYITGGGATHEGIEGHAMFVPVRSWTTNTRQTADNMGLPMASTAVINSHQFLQGDPMAQHNLKAIRPADVAQEVLGYMACETDGHAGAFDGILAADLSKNVVMSKTDNLNPAHHARELLKIAANVSNEARFGQVENAIGDSLNSPGILETPLTGNDFFRTMMMSTGTVSMVGFMGWTMAEINNVFSNLLDVMNLNLLNPTSFGAVDNLFGSKEYGSASPFEVIASEVAYLTVHLLIKCGLTHLDFSATNNPHHTQGIVGSDDGVEIITGAFGSVLHHDEYAINRVEQFKQLLKQHFFAKHTTGFMHTTTIISVNVQCSVFGETSVELFFNGNQDDTRRFVNATYCINRTSTNIAGSELGLQEAKNFMDNITEYFAK
jgi:hypothetical protein